MREIDSLENRSINEDLESATTLPPVAGQFWVKGMNKYAHKRKPVAPSEPGRVPGYRKSNKPISLPPNPMDKKNE